MSMTEDGKYITTLPEQVKIWYAKLISKYEHLKALYEHQPEPTDYSNGFLEGRISELWERMQNFTLIFPEVHLDLPKPPAFYSPVMPRRIVETVSKKDL